MGKNPMPGHLSELHPVNEVNTKGQFFRASFGKKPQVPNTARQAASLPGDISRGSSHPYMTTGKTVALTRWTFVGKVMSLLFNMLSRLVITFLPRSKRLLISWLQSPSVVILEPPKIKSDTVSTVSPSICHEVMELDAMIFGF